MTTPIRGFYGYPRRQRNQMPWRFQHAPRETVRGAIRGVAARERLLFPSPAKSAQRRRRLRLVAAYVRRFGHDEFVAQYAHARLSAPRSSNWLPGGFAWWRERLAREAQSACTLATRRLTPSEYELARWMLEHGTPEAIPFLEQLARADATTWRCFCGCASFNFKVRGEPDAPPGVNILAEFIVGEGAGTFGVFIFQSGGILSGVEVYALGAAAPATLPKPRQLRPV